MKKLLFLLVFIPLVSFGQSKQDDADKYFFMAIEFEKNGEYNKALENYNKSIEIFGKDGAYNNRGMLKYSKLGDLNGAYNDLLKSIEINPKSYKYQNISYILWDLKDYEGAIKYLEKVISIEPNNANAYSWLGNSKLELNEFYDAIYYFTKTIELEPELGLWYIRRGIAKEKLGDLNGACKDYELGYRVNKKFQNFDSKTVNAWLEKCN